MQGVWQAIRYDQWIRPTSSSPDKYSQSQKVDNIDRDAKAIFARANTANMPAGSGSGRGGVVIGFAEEKPDTTPAITGS